MRHQHKPNVQSIPAGGEAWSHYRALTPPAIVLCEWEMVLVFDPRSVYRERRTDERGWEDRERKREREEEGRVVALAWRLVGGCVGLLPVSTDLY